MKHQTVHNRAQQFQPITLILLDINMPVLDGFETLKRIKEIFTEHNEMLNKLFGDTET